MFWTDAVQASERLTGSIVNFDGHPTLIDRIESRKSGPAALSRKLGGAEDPEYISLDNEKWNNFRDLPKLGWFNYLGGSGKIHPFYVERRAVHTRIHGITSNNTRVFSCKAEGVTANSRDYNVVDLFRNTGYLETCKSDEEFPKVSEILMALDPEPSAVAFAPKFCVVVTDEGMKWLYRKTKRIGFFTGTDSLNLFPKMGYYKEELQRCPTFDIQNVREF